MISFRICLSPPLPPLPTGTWKMAGYTFTPSEAERYFSQQRSFLFFNPSLYLRYKLDYHWTISLYGSLHRSAGDVSDLYP